MSDVQQPNRLAMNFHSRWLTGRLTYDIEPVEGGSLLRQRETVRLRMLPGRLSPFIERRMRPRLEERLADIKAILEA